MYQVLHIVQLPNEESDVLDGKIDLDITFCGTTTKTPVYVKLNAPEQLLLSEGVCRQLAYHLDVLTSKSGCGTQKGGHQSRKAKGRVDTGTTEPAAGRVTGHVTKLGTQTAEDRQQMMTKKMKTGSQSL